MPLQLSSYLSFPRPAASAYELLPSCTTEDFRQILQPLWMKRNKIMIASLVAGSVLLVALVTMRLGSVLQRFRCRWLTVSNAPRT